MGTGVAIQEQWMLVTLTAGIGGSLISVWKCCRSWSYGKTSWYIYL